MRADADELMHGRAAAQNRKIADLDMAAQHHIVGQDDALAEAAIVRDMRIGEEDAARADDRLAAAPRSPGIHRHPLADHAILADRQSDGFAAIFQILRLLADRGEWKDARPSADRRRTRDAHMRNQFDAVAERRPGPDMAERADPHAGAQARAGLYARAGMDEA